MEIGKCQGYQQCPGNHRPCQHPAYLGDSPRYQEKSPLFLPYLESQSGLSSLMGAQSGNSKTEYIQDVNS